MFIRRQEMIDRFDTNFRETADGGILFQPPYEKLGVPISWEEYGQAMAEFERRQKINQAISGVVMLTAGGFGLFHVISEDRYLPFFLAIGLAVLFSFSLSFRDTISPLLPFIKRRTELLKTLENND